MLTCEFLKIRKNSFFIEHLWTAVCNFGTYLETLSINYDLGKYLKTLTIIIGFVDNIWYFSVAMKQS